MNNKLKLGLIVGGTTLAGLGLAYYFMKGKKGNPKDPVTKKAVVPPITTASQEACLTFPIKRGAGYTKECEKAAVKLIQTWINNQSFNFQDWLYVTWVDGKFGVDTEDLLWYYTNQKTVDKAFFEQIKKELEQGTITLTLQ